MDASDLVDVRGLVVRRGAFSLEVPTFRVAAGEVVGVVGPNGAGKTTLLEAIAGLRPVHDGLLRVFGLDPWAQPVAVRSALGFMSDDMPLFELRVDRLLQMLSGSTPRGTASSCRGSWNASRSTCARRSAPSRTGRAPVSDW